MLLGNTDVEEPGREFLRKRSQPRRACHRRGERDNVFALVGCPEKLFREDRGPAGPRFTERLTRHRVDDAGGVHLVSLVVDSRSEAVALLGGHVNDQRAVVLLCVR